MKLYFKTFKNSHEKPIIILTFFKLYVNELLIIFLRLFSENFYLSLLYRHLKFENMKIRISLLLLILHSTMLLSQSGVLKGTIRDEKDNQPLIGAIIQITGTTMATTSELDGTYIINDIKPGVYNVEFSYLGYETRLFNEIEIQSAKPTILDVSLSFVSAQLETITVKAEEFKKTAESPVSLKNLGVAEIRRNPGGNRDVSKVIQSLPGVTSTASFRNDLIIRGGAPNENRFYIDDVEIPNINHFATQGSSGGPAGIINIDFIREVDFLGSAFPVSRGNAVSSVFNFKFKDGRDDRWGSIATIGATDIGLTLEGPLSSKTTMMFSVRRSYLQFLFKAIGLPFLPTYTDFNTKIKYKIDNKSEIYFIGIGAIDDFRLNLDAGDTEEKQYILENLPVNEQWNYTNGIVYKRYNDKSVTSYILSRNMLNNTANKFKNNDDSDPENLILEYQSREIENKLRIENLRKVRGYEILGGILYEYAKFSAQTYNKIFTNEGFDIINSSSDISFHKYGLFGNVSRKFLQDRLRISAGFRVDGNSLNDEMSNPLKQFSPRMAVSYELSPGLFINGAIGRYFQLPPYTSLGYRNNEGDLVNAQNGITYIKADHFVAGLEWNTNFSSRITVEGYYKLYSQYPFLVRESISLANLGGDFGVIGNQEAVSASEGRTYGVECMFQQKLYKGFYGIVAYTLGFSEFKDSVDYIPTSWDARHIVNFSLGKRFSSDWEVGLKWRYQSGLPFTPFDDRSSLVANWDVNGRALPDYSRLNSLRTDGAGIVDLRIDKKWFFKKWDLNVYLDIQNLTAASVSRDVLLLDRPLDADGKAIGPGIIENPDEPADQQRYKLKRVMDNTATVLPTIGVVVTL